MTSLYLVHGPPGTGKTTYLNRQATIGAQKHGVDGVCIASLTRTAAHEIAGRDNPIPDQNVGTLHSHAFHALERPELAETPEGIRAFNDAHPSRKLNGGQRLEDTLQAADPDSTPGAGAGDSLHNQVMTLRARQVPRTAWTPDQIEHDTVWTDFKTQTHRLDFTDLIERAITDVDEHPVHPAVWLFDEAQDFSPLELRLAVHWARHAKTAVIVADGDQAIYGWRGADPHHLYDLDLAGERVLEQSHRVPRAAHQLADQWIRQLADRRPIVYKPTTAPGTVGHHPATIRTPDSWLHQIAADLDAGRTVMALTSCGYMLTPLIATLRAHGIPFHNPYRPERGQWNPMRGARRLRAYLAPLPVDQGGHDRAWTWQDVHDWMDPLRAAGVLARGAKTYLANKIEPNNFGESQAADTADLEAVMSLIGTTDLRHPALRLDVDWWKDNLLAQHGKTAEYPAQVLNRQGGTGLSHKPRLTVGTIHSVKGGEADSVYIAPDLSNTGMSSWETPGVGHDQIVRLFYVALTRTRDRATILAPADANHIPLDLLRHDDLAAAA